MSLIYGMWTMVSLNITTFIFFLILCFVVGSRTWRRYVTLCLSHKITDYPYLSYTITEFCNPILQLREQISKLLFSQQRGYYLGDLVSYTFNFKLRMQNLIIYSAVESLNLQTEEIRKMSNELSHLAWLVWNLFLLMWFWSWI